MLTTATLLSLLPAFAAAASCPAPHSPPSPPPGNPGTCGSLHAKWTLSPISLSSYYTYTSPSASGPKLGSIDFVFKNDQVDYSSTCKGSSANPQGIFYGSTWFDCETQGGNQGWKKTSFAYDTATSVVNVTSTWSCPGGDVVYTTYANGKADLKCETSVWENDDWQAGELYSNTTTTCALGTLVIQN
ncbi:hypothetical protein P154DRAFT_559397 [Amniculicola lignicola CBS 123094]|uniref:AA1-like domain-containing protein n=1 Tax=Amniculicola lignicola CBS 123094 TaxID=1392246 RepID=A0A6A5WWX0_9PLEO|nr:hypothetical protein P154DRAFT_559397 [Amniculicola lignicola CBS 123094]